MNLRDYKDHLRISIEDDKIEFLENESRRNNIRVNSIPEDDHETWSSGEIKLKRYRRRKIGPEFRTNDRLGDCSSRGSTAEIVASRQFQNKLGLPSGNALQCCIFNLQIVDYCLELNFITSVFCPFLLFFALSDKLIGVAFSTLMTFSILMLHFLL